MSSSENETISQVWNQDLVGLDEPPSDPPSSPSVVQSGRLDNESGKESDTHDSPLKIYSPMIDAACLYSPPCVLPENVPKRVARPKPAAAPKTDADVRRKTFYQTTGKRKTVEPEAIDLTSDNESTCVEVKPPKIGKVEEEIPASFEVDTIPTDIHTWDGITLLEPSQSTLPVTPEEPVDVTKKAYFYYHQPDTIVLPKLVVNGKLEHVWRPIREPCHYVRSGEDSGYEVSFVNGAEWKKFIKDCWEKGDLKSLISPTPITVIRYQY